MTRSAKTLILTFALMATASLGEACSRVLWNDNGFAVMVGHTMDWPASG